MGTPQQNGRVKRKHRHILNVARALRFQASLPIEFWGECIMTAAYLINRTPTPLLAGHTPFERLYKRPPPLTHLRTFGCPCYAHNQNHKGDKFASRSIKGVFLGYPYGKKGWRILNPLTGKIFASRDVIFCESQFPYSNVSASASSSSSSPIITESTVLEEEPVPLSSVRPSSSDSVPPASSDSVLAEHASPDPLTNNTNPTSDIETGAELTPLLSTNLSDSFTPPVDTAPTEDVLTSNDNNNTISQLATDTSPAAIIETEQETEARVSSADNLPTTELGRGLRTKTITAKLHDYVLQTISSVVSCHTKSPYGIEFYVDCSRFSESHCHFLAVISSLVEPKSYREAILDEFWRASIQDEYISLEIIILGASLIYRLENMLSFVNGFSSTNFMLTVLLNDANRD